MTKINDIKVIGFEGELVTDSRDVAKMTGKEHKELLRSIRSYVGVLTSAKMRSLDFFIPSEYEDAKKEIRPSYLLTRKGCDMVANKMTGERGILFTAAYVSKFDEMEKELRKPVNNMQLLLESALLHEKEISGIKEDVQMLKDTMRITSEQQFTLKAAGTRKVLDCLGGRLVPAYESMKRKVFSEFWRDLKSHFMIPRYGDVTKKQFPEAMKFIALWEPSTSTKMQIEKTNDQTQFSLEA
ncbi:ORF6C domain-containing protein [Viridibacillus sp. FSL H8-0110]|uniref:ORF6C domain-containing protein n=1 Tax=Viridibacillus sp. FSL H8-0110 TaxID=2921376 RepID=UPI0030FCD185